MKKELGTCCTFQNNLETLMQSRLTWHPSSSKFAFSRFFFILKKNPLFLLVNASCSFSFL